MSTTIKCTSCGLNYTEDLKGTFRHQCNGTCGEGVKHDEGKPKMHLVTPELIAMTSRALEYGMGKYGKDNYKQGMDWSRVIDALLRHTYAFANKEDHDTESSLNHLCHMGACVNMLAYYYIRNIGKDDR